MLLEGRGGIYIGKIIIKEEYMKQHYFNEICDKLLGLYIIPIHQS